MSLLQEGLADDIDILIAEEDPNARRDLRRLLEHEGYHCAEAGNCQEAVELAQQHPPKFVLLDLVPTKEDFKFARWLRADPRMHAAYIHCLTGQTEELPASEAAQAGCNAIISKPVDSTELLELVHEELGCPSEWVHGLTKNEAEDQLDWLQNQGSPGQVTCESNQSFAVRCPGGLRGGVDRAKAPARGRIILLVEDDDCVRSFAKVVLEQHGYMVLDARHGGEALEVCETRSEPIDLIITDIDMPNLSGRQLAAQLAIRRPTMKVLLMSGDTDDGTGPPFLQKPFTLSVLVHKVREILDATG